MAAEEDVKKGGRDPILLVCFITLVLAFGIVGGIHIHSEYLSTDGSDPATAGRTVDVNYNGSFYDFYDNGGIVFDTSFWNIADNDDYSKSFEFNLRAESAYKPLSFQVGDPKHGGLLPMFANAVTGMQKGDVARIIIDPANGYGLLTETMINKVAGPFTVPLAESVPYDLFKANYNDGKDISNNMTMKSPFGWDMDVTFSGTNADVQIMHKPISGKVYDMNDDVKVKVTNVGKTVTYEFDIDYQTYTENFEGDWKDAKFSLGSITDFEYVKTVKVFHEGREYYLYAVDDAENPTEWVLKYIFTDAEKTAKGLSSYSETTGMFLCFVITVANVK